MLSGAVKMIVIDPAARDRGRADTCEEPKRVTCGSCLRSWCEACDPAPSAMCHYCNGLGYSTASLAPAEEAT